MFFIALLAVALLVSSSVAAQDKLVKRTGEEMKVKVLSVTKNKVKFVRQGTEAPVYTLPVSDIQYIEYPTGDRDTFGVLVSSQASAEVQRTSGREKWLGPVPTPDGRLSVSLEEAIANSEQHTYKIGDIYNKNGVVGIVVTLTDEGRHGTIMSLDEACLVWTTRSRKEVERVGASSVTDGEENMRAIAKYIAEKGLAWSDFPAFEWCRAKGEGWYLPSVNEVWAAGTMYMGGSRVAPKLPLRRAFNDTIEALGGKAVSNSMFYHTSTESDKDKRDVQYSHMNGDTPYLGVCDKRDELFVRAFHKF